jgi:hypothetical protein
MLDVFVVCYFWPRFCVLETRNTLKIVLTFIIKVMIGVQKEYLDGWKK